MQLLDSGIGHGLAGADRTNSQFVRTLGDVPAFMEQKLRQSKDGTGLIGQSAPRVCSAFMVADRSS